MGVCKDCSLSVDGLGCGGLMMGRVSTGKRNWRRCYDRSMG